MPARRVPGAGPRQTQRRSWHRVWHPPCTFPRVREDELARKIPLFLLGLAVVAAGCSQPLTSGEKGALVGGAVGAGAGAIIGHESGHPGVGAVIGGAVGAVTGAVIADAARRAEHQAAYPPPPPAQVVVAAPPRVVVPTAPHMVWVPEWGVYGMDGHDIAYHPTSYHPHPNRH